METPSGLQDHPVLSLLETPGAREKFKLSFKVLLSLLKTNPRQFDPRLGEVVMIAVVNPLTI